MYEEDDHLDVAARDALPSDPIKFDLFVGTWDSLPGAPLGSQWMPVDEALSHCADTRRVGLLQAALEWIERTDRG